MALCRPWLPAKDGARLPPFCCGLQAETSMGGEDFSFIAQKVPASYTFLGIRNEQLGSVWPLHSPHFTLDEDVLPIGASLFAGLAIEYMAGPTPGAKEL